MAWTEETIGIRDDTEDEDDLDRLDPGLCWTTKHAAPGHQEVLASGAATPARRRRVLVDPESPFENRGCLWVRVLRASRP